MWFIPLNVSFRIRKTRTSWLLDVRVKLIF